eukprot:gnl/MRDRNA2_/MRDRNA2_88365_c0_seq1.p1 gnl/MRDRNA2_/MRDRNA2_88365_c0~~gnl/MRDRNA2_/MRDRNA2_88365_c0_seq1.p1  ORF type:complete len:178 (+),score=58.16 gnl/MRDRNA2_/MRDRNA2_88365_c0_seq1:110-643(+)
MVRRSEKKSALSASKRKTTSVLKTKTKEKEKEKAQEKAEDETIKLLQASGRPEEAKVVKPSNSKKRRRLAARRQAEKDAENSIAKKIGISGEVVSRRFHIPKPKMDGSLMLNEIDEACEHAELVAEAAQKSGGRRRNRAGKLSKHNKDVLALAEARTEFVLPPIPGKRPAASGMDVG